MSSLILAASLALICSTVAMIIAAVQLSQSPTEPRQTDFMLDLVDRIDQLEIACHLLEEENERLVRANNKLRQLS